jgi:hypothetical protein
MIDFQFLRLIRTLALKGLLDLVMSAHSYNSRAMFLGRQTQPLADMHTHTHTTHTHTTHTLHAHTLHTHTHTHTHTQTEKTKLFPSLDLPPPFPFKAAPGCSCKNFDNSFCSLYGLHTFDFFQISFAFTLSGGMYDKVVLSLHRNLGLAECRWYCNLFARQCLLGDSTYSGEHCHFEQKN